MSSASTKIIQATAGNIAADGAEPVGIDFDGSNDYLSRSSDLTGNSDGKTFTFSVWLYIDTYSSGDLVYAGYVGGSRRLGFRLDASNRFSMDFRNSSGTSIFNVEASANTLPINTWFHYLISADLSDTGKRYFYVNDADFSSNVTVNTYTNQNIDFTCGAHFIGSDDSSNNLFDGRLAGVYLDYTYRDLSVEANRRDFIDENGLYVTPPTSGIISVPMDDPDDPGRNDGTGGDFTLNGVVAQSGRGPNQYNAAASTFDGSADYLSRTSALSGATDGKQLSYSVWFKLDSDTGGNIYRTTGNISGITYLGSGNFRIENKTPVAADALEFQSTSAPVIVGKWHHLTCSFDMTSTGKRHVYLDGVSVTGNYNYYTNTNLDFSNTNQYVGQNGSGSSYFDGEISNLWFDTTYIDLSADNPFYDTDTGKPKFLGSDGSEPTSSAPLIYLPLRGDDAGNNLGTGGDFTVNSGPYTGARGPSEFWGESAEFNGTDQNLTKASTFTGVSDGKAFTFLCSAFFDVTSNGDTIFSFIDGATYSLRASVGANSRELNLFGTNASGTTILSAQTGNNVLTTGGWKNILVSVDMTSASKRHIYINDSNISATWSTYTNDNFNFAGLDSNNIASFSSGSSFLNGKIGFLWFNTEYIDFSQEANRLKFFDAFNNPVDLGEDGSTPTGSQPLIYLNEGFHLGTNLGSGGNFTPQNTPTDGGYVKG